VDDARPFTAAEMNFFSTFGAGNGEVAKMTPCIYMLMGSSLPVPVIVIFTKFDARYDEAFGDLEKEGVLWEEAVTLAPQRAHADFEKKFLGSLYKKEYPPKAHVYLQGQKPLLFCLRWQKLIEYPRHG